MKTYTFGQPVKSIVEWLIVLHSSQDERLQVKSSGNS